MTHQHERETAGRILQQDYPCTLLLMEDRVDDAIERFCHWQSEPAGLAQAKTCDCWWMFLRSGIAVELNLPPYAADVATYEGAVTALNASTDGLRDARSFAERNSILPSSSLADPGTRVPVKGSHVRVEHFAFDAPAIVAAIENCDRLEPVERPAARTILLVKPPNAEGPRPLRINSQLERLLAACDGTANCDAITRALTGSAGPSLRRSVDDAIESLRDRNVLTFREWGLLIEQ